MLERHCAAPTATSNEDRLVGNTCRHIVRDSTGNRRLNKVWLVSMRLNRLTSRLTRDWATYRSCDVHYDHQNENPATVRKKLKIIFKVIIILKVSRSNFAPKCCVVAFLSKLISYPVCQPGDSLDSRRTPALKRFQRCND